MLSPRVSNKMGLEAAVEAAAALLNKAVKPVMVGGPKLRVAKACNSFVELADACGYALAVMPSAKGLVPEHHPHFIGTYWGAVTAQDVSTMIRSGQKSIIFLINNGGYTIEVEIHDGPYNVIKNWNYIALVDAIHNGEGNCWTTKDDTSKELLEWGSRVSAANSRPPNPQ
ncbi:unnamed protein product [Fraxinus pennsylvanica]|uniref:pyruvate decarboxylase n=1 Tax=Fraxinus pennsylvanica TaxID=56036 RepID=A0AAD2A0W4_9LAMI|nr:unnamed protein product [Fraxinus pennsylvanica]